MQATTSRPLLKVSADGVGVVSHAGTRLIADVAELTGILPQLTGNGWPPGMRVLVRRERPHPGAQLNLFEEANGWRYRCFVTNTPTGQFGWLEARHRAHARVEDRIRCGKDVGLGRLPSRPFNINVSGLSSPWLLPI